MMDPVQVALFSVGATCLFVGAVNRWRRGRNGAWFLVLGALIFLLGGFVLGA